MGFTVYILILELMLHILNTITGRLNTLIKLLIPSKDMCPTFTSQTLLILFHINCNPKCSIHQFSHYSNNQANVFLCPCIVPEILYICGRISGGNQSQIHVQHRRSTTIQSNMPDTVSFSFIIHLLAWWS